MQIFKSLTAAVVTFAGLASAEFTATGNQLQVPKLIPGRYIVEYNTDVDSFRRKRDASSAEDLLTSDLADIGVSGQIVHDLNSKYFQGVSIEIEATVNGTTEEYINSLDYVANVYPVEILSLPEMIKEAPADYDWNPHLVTGVDRLHKEGVTGNGINIAVIDSGVNYFYDALGGGIGPGYKVVGGHDYVGDGHDPSDPNTASEDDDPLDCYGHGTFVSTVLAGIGKDVIGVAPDVNLYMYRVFGCTGTTSNDIILKALSDAAEAKPDVINLSLGSLGGFNSAPVSKLASEIAKDDIVVVYAAGNSGETGSFYASNGAAGKNVIAVGSVEAVQEIRWPAQLICSDGTTFATFYYTQDSVQSSYQGKLDVDFSTTDGCNYRKERSSARSQDTTALVLKRGICYSNNEYTTLENIGYNYVFTYNSYDQNPNDFENVAQTLYSRLLFARFDADVGTYIKEKIDLGYSVQIELNPEDQADAFTSRAPGAGKSSFFSSMGPTVENDFFPAVSAPGGHVYGLFGDTWEISSGTSFSCPYVAGVVALYKSVYGTDISTIDVKRKLVSTAKAMRLYNEVSKSTGTVQHPYIQQGAGLINAYNFIHYNSSILSSPFLELNDTANRVDEFEIEVYNGNAVSVEYTISHETSATINARDDYWYPYEYFPQYDTSTAVVSFSSDSIIIGPGTSGKVLVKITPPSSTFESALFEGKIVLNGDNGEVLGVPYMGIEVDTYEWTPLEDTPFYAWYNESDGYTYPLRYVTNMSFDVRFGDSPILYYALRYATEFFSIDLVKEDYDLEEDFAFPESSEKFCGSLRSNPDVYGSYAYWPLQYGPRFSGVGFNGFTAFADNSDIPKGRYRLMTRALKAFGDRQNINDWQRFLSVPFNISGNGTSEEPVISSSLAEISLSSFILSSEQLSSGIESSSTSVIIESSSVSGVLIVSSTSDLSAEESQVASVSSVSESVFTIALSTISTSTFGASSVPTGYDGILSLRLLSEGSGTEVVYDRNGWLLLDVEFYVAKKTWEGTVIQFSIPSEFTDVGSGVSIQDSGNLVASGTFDKITHIFSITFYEYITWHSQVSGSFQISMRLSDDAKNEIEAPGLVLYKFDTVKDDWDLSLDFRPYPNHPVVVGAINGDGLPEWVIRVPYAFGYWSSVQVTSTLEVNSFFVFECSEASTSIGTDFDKWNQVIEAYPASSDDSKNVCALRALDFQYSTPSSNLTKRLDSEDILLHSVIGSPVYDYLEIFDLNFVLTGVYPNGTVFTTYLPSIIRSNSFYSSNGAYGERDVPAYTGEEASVSSSATLLISLEVELESSSSKLLTSIVPSTLSSEIGTSDYHTQSTKDSHLTETSGELLLLLQISAASSNMPLQSDSETLPTDIPSEVYYSSDKSSSFDSSDVIPSSISLESSPATNTAIYNESSATLQPSNSDDQATQSYSSSFISDQIFSSGEVDDTTTTSSDSPSSTILATPSLSAYSHKGQPVFNLIVPGSLTPFSAEAFTNKTFSWSDSIEVNIDLQQALEAYYSLIESSHYYKNLLFQKLLEAEKNASLTLSGISVANGEYPATFYLIVGKSNTEVIKRGERTFTLTATATVKESESSSAIASHSIVSELSDATGTPILLLVSSTFEVDNSESLTTLVQTESLTTTSTAGSCNERECAEHFSSEIAINSPASNESTSVNTIPTKTLHPTTVTYTVTSCDLTSCHAIAHTGVVNEVHSTNIHGEVSTSYMTVLCGSELDSVSVGASIPVSNVNTATQAYFTPKGPTTTAGDYPIENSYSTEVTGSLERKTILKSTTQHTTDIIETETQGFTSSGESLILSSSLLETHLSTAVSSYEGSACRVVAGSLTMFSIVFACLFMF